MTTMRAPRPRKNSAGSGEFHHLVLQSALAPGQFCTYAHALLRDGTGTGLHDHDYYEMFWVLEGSGYHLINGQTMELTAGMLLMIRSEDVHCFKSPAGGMIHFTNLAFFPSTWDAIRARYFGSKPAFFDLKPIEARQYVLTPAKMIELRQAARDLEGGARSLFATERFLLDVLGILQSHQISSETSLTPRWLVQACEDLHQLKNFEGGTMMFATKIAGRSPAHVARACKKYLGTTPTDIVNQARIAHASVRLVTTNDSILDISLDCGFQNLGHFYRLFRKTHGSSPSAYRRQQMAALSAGASPSE